MRYGLIIAALFLSSCKAAKPELTSLLGQQNGIFSNSTDGRPIGGGQTLLGSSTNYKIRGRVALTPQEISGSTTNFKVRGSVKL